MNKSQRIYLDTENAGVDKYIKVKLEQNVQTLEFLTLSLSTEDVYQSYNADYGVLIGRVLANDGIGIPNAKISIFIALTDEDAQNGEIFSIYPYKTPRDKNNEGKRYNLLPRVAQFEQASGTYKPKQPFGSFPIKPEVVTNIPFLNVYKKYYKYTALTNQYGDYMIFGVPTGTQTVHLSVDITDIGKYSMTPSSMIKAGYPTNLFTDNANAIKPSDDLTDLPNIETQEISVEIIPFWGDVENFEIGITRQDFRIKATLSSDFIIFGTTMTMGQWGMFGNPGGGSSTAQTNFGFYRLDTDQGGYENNMDIRTYRSVPPIIRLFTYTNDIPIDALGNLLLPTDIDFDRQIREMDKSEYFEYNVNGNFMLTVPCNRRRVTTAEDGSDIVVDDNSSFGVYTRFYGMILITYPSITELTEDSAWSYKFNGPNPCHKARGWFKIPQSVGLQPDDRTVDDLGAALDGNAENNKWRKEYFTFSGGGVYSVAQFYATKWARGAWDEAEAIQSYDNTENTFAANGSDGEVSWTAGMWFKTEGRDDVTQTGEYDNQNYLINPATGTTPQFRYDFSPNLNTFDEGQTFTDASNKYFGGQWLNFALLFPQYGWAFYNSGANNRNYQVADIFHNGYRSTNEYQLVDNDQKLFANITNTKSLIKGDAFQTAFIDVPKGELQKLFDIPYKGINVRRWNNNTMESIPYGTRTQLLLPTLSVMPYKYLNPKTNYTTVPSAQITNGREYNRFGWDEYASTYTGIQTGEPKTAYLFKGMHSNDVIKMLSNFGVI